MGWAYGIHAVEGLLKGSPERIQEIWLVKSRRPGPARQRLRTLAEESGVRFRMVGDAQLRRAVGEVTHQGVGARVSDFAYADATTLLDAAGPALVVVLDEVQDPHNLGAVIRSALGLGASGIILPKHRSVGVTPAVSKVAVGAETSLPVAQVTNLARFLEHAREAGFWVYGATASGSEALGQVEFAERTVLVLGSERRGIRPNVASRCDVEVAIPLGEIESLNVSVAAGILMWEWARQRRSETA